MQKITLIATLILSIGSLAFGSPLAQEQSPTLRIKAALKATQDEANRQKAEAAELLKEIQLDSSRTGSLHKETIATRKQFQSQKAKVITDKQTQKSSRKIVHLLSRFAPDSNNFYMDNSHKDLKENGTFLLFSLSDEEHENLDQRLNSIVSTLNSIENQNSLDCKNINGDMQIVRTTIELSINRLKNASEEAKDTTKKLSESQIENLNRTMNALEINKNVCSQIITGNKKNPQAIENLNSLVANLALLFPQSMGILNIDDFGDKVEVKNPSHLGTDATP